MAISSIVAGCLSFPKEPTVVSDSQLNWLSVQYRPAEGSPPPCRFDIIGAGYIDFMQGYSPRLADAFSMDVEDPNWNSANQEKIGMSPDNARKLIQQFVTAGLLELPPQPRKAPDNIRGIARFRWNINNKPGGCVTSDELLIEMVETLASQLGAMRP